MRLRAWLAVWLSAWPCTYASAQPTAAPDEAPFPAPVLWEAGSSEAPDDAAVQDAPAPPVVGSRAAAPAVPEPVAAPAPAIAPPTRVISVAPMATSAEPAAAGDAEHNFEIVMLFGYGVAVVRSGDNPFSTSFQFRTGPKLADHLWLDGVLHLSLGTTTTVDGVEVSATQDFVGAQLAYELDMAEALYLRPYAGLAYGIFVGKGARTEVPPSGPAFTTQYDTDENGLCVMLGSELRYDFGSIAFIGLDLGLAIVANGNVIAGLLPMITFGIY